MAPEAWPRWQLQLPAPVAAMLASAERASDAWHRAFPPKDPEQKELEGKVWWAVLRGDLHPSALDDLKQGKPIEFDKMAEEVKRGSID
jgi:hypothetical protein